MVMVKDEFKKAFPKPKRKEKKTQKYIAVLVTSEEHDSFRKAAGECGCSMGEYIRRLHKYIQGN